MEYPHLHMILIVLTVTAVLARAQMGIDVAPQNVVSLVGESVSFRCETEAGSQSDSGFNGILQWSRDIGNGSEIIAMFINGGQQPGVVSDMERYTFTDRVNLQIDDVSLADGGEYSCDVSPAGQKETAALIVMEHPVASGPAEMVTGGATEQFTCHMTYRGPDSVPADMQPVLAVSTNGNELVRVADQAREDTGHVMLSHTLDLSMEAGSTASLHNFSCQVSTTEPPMSLQENVSTKLTVPPHNIVLSPVKTNYTVGDVITCSAQGTPTPTIKWTSGDLEISSSILELTASMLGSNSWSCSADNIIKGDKEVAELLLEFNVVPVPVEPEPETTEAEPTTSSPEVEVTEETPPESGSPTIIIVVVCVLMLLLALIVIAVVCIRKRRSSGSNYEAGKAERKVEKESKSNGKHYNKVSSDEDDDTPEVKVEFTKENPEKPVDNGDPGDKKQSGDNGDSVVNGGSDVKEEKAPISNDVIV